jgi:hypothetical protein
MLLEFSLKFNNETAVFSSPQNNKLQLPGQMLPFFGFVSVQYLASENWRGLVDGEPSLSSEKRAGQASFVHAAHPC